MIHWWPIPVQLDLFSDVALSTNIHGGWGSRELHVWAGHGGSICVEALENVVLCILSPLLSSVPIDPLSGSLRRGRTASPSQTRRTVRGGEERRQSAARLIDLAEEKAIGAFATIGCPVRSRVASTMALKVRWQGEPPPVYGKCGFCAVD